MAKNESSTIRQRGSRRKTRQWTGSVKGTLESIDQDPTHHITGDLLHGDQESIPGSTHNANFLHINEMFKRASEKLPMFLPGIGEDERNNGLWNGIKTMRWVKEPALSFQLLLIPLVLCINFELVTRYVLNTPCFNPFKPFLLISYYLPDSSLEDPRYGKGYWDLAFLAYYVVFWSFVRQLVTLHVMPPLALSFGIRKKSKLARFAEQGYAVLYFGVFGSLGIYVMSQLPTWWFKTEHFWIEYPQWRMTPLLKAYYLLQASYWIQQLFVMVLGLEKRRKDFMELVMHHIVTIYLISASYIVGLTWIGNAVFITMDVSDAFFSLSKVFNYLGMDKTKFVSLGWFTIVWGYTRHWLNFVMLYSVWFEFDLIPEQNRRLDVQAGLFMPPWVKYLIFVPLLLLQLLNLFYYFLIWRIFFRALFIEDLSKIDDDRSDDENDGDDEDELDGEKGTA